MDTKEFKIKLIEAEVNNLEFAKLTGLNPKSITNWNQQGKKPPEWVEPFLNYYIKAKKKEIKMNDIKELLKQKYLMLNLRKPQDCLKLSYQYHQVKVNTYFDYYENTFNLFLVLNYEKSYYFTPLNIDNLIVKNPYLNDLPKEILGQILDNGSLKDFYDNMREHMIHDDVQKSNYEDYEFKNGLKSNKNNDKNPFLSHLRKTPMSENHLNFLNTQFNISKYILQRIRAKGYTIVTTANFSERKSLTLILNESSIKL
ncbi:TPA: hypothetical protein R2P05_000437 [Campylobacter jejuni]|nr:hypothetical protein [Campylobacter jejuni]EFN6207330.1 hypothetical protein [Campylobacter jejuni]HEC2934273.1 hypothetical protein [Campylobacter jejuni]HEC2939547.1 hypothetical protein [Campylobacter jejuni]HEC2941317.1 hypothetical protein [Campylobacter jejuni]